MRWLVVIVALAGCEQERAASAAYAKPEPTIVDAAPLVAKFECNRCHELTAVAPAPHEKHCVACHQAIHNGTVGAKPNVIAGWRKRVTSLRWVPSLAAADRFRRAWLREFLRAPHDVRPGLAASMPRLAISEAEATQLAAYLVPHDEPQSSAPLRSDITRGEQLYRALACARCHRFSGAGVDDAALHAGGQHAVQDGSWALAPDLRHARARMELAQIVTWIVRPRGAMPDQKIEAAEARALGAFIVAAPLAAVPPRVVAARLPILERAVTWDEVESKVFRNVCWHCHAQPDYARGDGGPGNTGGFGFAARGLDLSSHAAMSAGSLDDAGEARSVFAKLPDGTPRLVAHLLARHTEEAGGTVAGVRGMPLGLPALPMEDIQLVETWIAQGRAP